MPLGFVGMVIVVLQVGPLFTWCAVPQMVLPLPEAPLSAVLTQLLAAAEIVVEHRSDPPVTLTAELLVEFIEIWQPLLVESVLPPLTLRSVPVPPCRQTQFELAASAAAVAVAATVSFDIVGANAPRKNV